MLQLKDIMTHDVVTLGPDLGLRDAMELLVRRHVSGAPVVLNGKVVGMLTLTDLVEYAANLPGRADADEIDEEREYPDLPAWTEDDEQPDDYFAESWNADTVDVVQRFAERRGREWSAFESRTVADAMSTGRLCALPSTTLVEAAAEYMTAAKVHRLLVIDAGRLTGIVSAMDIAQAVGEHRLTKRTFVFGKDAAEASRVRTATRER